ncbi:MAG: FecR family protein [Nitrospirota bacterium]
MRRLYKIGLMILIALIIPDISLAAVAGKFTIIEGKVDLLKPGEKRASPVKEGDTVSVGDIVRTKSASKAQITFVDESTVNIGESSRLEITEFLFNPAEDKRSSVVKTFRGSVRSIVPKVFKAEGSRYEVNSTTAIAGIRGTDFVVISVPALTQVMALEGRVTVRNIDPKIVGVVTLGPKEATIVAINRPPAPPLPVKPEQIQSVIQGTTPKPKPKEEAPPPPPAEAPPAPPVAVAPPAPPAAPPPPAEAPPAPPVAVAPPPGVPPGLPPLMPAMPPLPGMPGLMPGIPITMFGPMMPGMPGPPMPGMIAPMPGMLLILGPPPPGVTGTFYVPITETSPSTTVNKTRVRINVNWQ